MFEHEYSIEELRQYFLTGLKPTEEQFYRFIKECYNNDTDVIAELQRWSLEELNALRDYVDNRDNYVISLINGIAAIMGSDFDVTFNVGGIHTGDKVHSGDTVQNVLKTILNQTFSGDTNELPSLELSATTEFGLYEAGTVLPNVSIGTTYKDGTFIDWSGSTVSGTTPSLCNSNKYYPTYYIDGAIVSTSNVVYKTNITVPIPQTVYDSASTTVYAVKSYDKSKGISHNSDGTINTSVVYPASEVSTEQHRFTGVFKYFGGLISKESLDTIVDSASVRSLTTFSGFINADGVDVTPFNQRILTSTDGSEYYLIVAVPVGYYVTVDNEASMDVPMRDSGNAVIGVKLGGGTSATMQGYKLFYTPFNGAAFRNLRINKN